MPRKTKEEIAQEEAEQAELLRALAHDPKAPQADRAAAALALAEADEHTHYQWTRGGRGGGYYPEAGNGNKNLHFAPGVPVPKKDVPVSLARALMQKGFIAPVTLEEEEAEQAEVLGAAITAGDAPPDAAAVPVVVDSVAGPVEVPAGAETTGDAPQEG